MPKNPSIASTSISEISPQTLFTGDAVSTYEGRPMKLISRSEIEHELLPDWEIEMSFWHSIIDRFVRIDVRTLVVSQILANTEAKVDEFANHTPGDTIDQ